MDQDADSFSTARHRPAMAKARALPPPLDWSVDSPDSQGISGGALLRGLTSATRRGQGPGFMRARAPVGKDNGFTVMSWDAQ